MGRRDGMWRRLVGTAIGLGLLAGGLLSPAPAAAQAAAAPGRGSGYYSVPAPGGATAERHLRHDGWDRGRGEDRGWRHYPDSAWRGRAWGWGPSYPPYYAPAYPLGRWVWDGYGWVWVVPGY